MKEKLEKKDHRDDLDLVWKVHDWMQCVHEGK